MKDYDNMTAQSVLEGLGEAAKLTPAEFEATSFDLFEEMRGNTVLNPEQFAEACEALCAKLMAQIEGIQSTANDYNNVQVQQIRTFLFALWWVSPIVVNDPVWHDKMVEDKVKRRSKEQGSDSSEGAKAMAVELVAKGKKVEAIAIMCGHTAEEVQEWVDEAEDSGS